MEMVYSKAFLRSSEGPGDVILSLKEMRARGIDKEAAENILEMQVFSMVSHAAFLIVSFFLLSLLGEAIGGDGFGRSILLSGMFLGAVYLGAGAAYSVDLTRAKLSPYSYAGKSHFRSLPLWLFWAISIVGSVFIFSIIV
ncbi:hypothetical protein [Nocardiopsis valliformis]|uniref:hypothetical protein n=1 Tax=Nocardiopsis valliformis TaxID=239974 RepID=UPI0012682EB7|nr:hypothetical protein [Nocardiopsis valliformis]